MTGSGFGNLMGDKKSHCLGSECIPSEFFVFLGIVIVAYGLILTIE